VKVYNNNNLDYVGSYEEERQNFNKGIRSTSNLQLPEFYEKIKKRRIERYAAQLAPHLIIAKCKACLNKDGHPIYEGIGLPEIEFLPSETEE